MSWLSRPRSHSCFLLEHMTQQLIFKGCRVEKLQPKYILMAFFRGTERKEKLRLHSGKLIIRTRNNPVVNTLRGFLQVFWHFNEYILVLLYYKNEQILISMIPYMPSLPGNQAYVFHFFKITINHPKY